MISPTHAELNFAMGGKPAFVDEAEIPVLCHYASQAQRIVEIGCAWGGSTVLFLLNMPERAQLYSVDPFIADSYGGWAASRFECADAVNRALNTFHQSNRIFHWSIYELYSEQAAGVWASTPIDLLFIDGDHTEKGVRVDWELWTPAIRSGGIVMLHDSRRIPGAPDEPFPRGWPAPTALANRLRTDVGWKLVDEVFSLTCWEKQ